MNKNEDDEAESWATYEKSVQNGERINEIMEAQTGFSDAQWQWLMDRMKIVKKGKDPNSPTFQKSGTQKSRDRQRKLQTKLKIKNASTIMLYASTFIEAFDDKDLEHIIPTQYVMMMLRNLVRREGLSLATGLIDAIDQGLNENISAQTKKTMKAKVRIYFEPQREEIYNLMP